MKGIFTVLLLACTQFVFAQFTAEQQASIDSIQQIIEHANHDSALVNAYIERANITYGIDLEEDKALFLTIEKICLENLENSPIPKEELFFDEQLAAMSDE